MCIFFILVQLHVIKVPKIIFSQKMELNHLDHAFLEELLEFRKDIWEQPIMDPPETMIHQGQFFSGGSGWNLDFLDESLPLSLLPNTTPSSSCDSFSVPTSHQDLNPASYYYPFDPNGVCYPSSVPEASLTPTMMEVSCNEPIRVQEGYPFASMEEDGPCFLLGEDLESFQMFQEATCKSEPPHESPEPAPLLAPPADFHPSLDRKGRAKDKPELGHPSKNLQAERRRRKRLNDRLSMLRSIVPKISKMDRTSILGDTIDYMKELLERINNLQRETDGPNHLDLLKDQRPIEVSIRNSPKFDVERRDGDTRIEICCAGTPGLLLSTVSKLEELGLEIEQCVISCFNDFAMQASCSQELEQRGSNEMGSCEDIKQVLFRNAGYGGKCL